MPKGLIQGPTVDSSIVWVQLPVSETTGRTIQALVVLIKMKKPGSFSVFFFFISFFISKAKPNPPLLRMTSKMSQNVRKGIDKSLLLTYSDIRGCHNSRAN